MLNNRGQSIGPRPDSRPRLEGAHYKYLTNCSRLLSRTSPFSHTYTCTHYQPDSSPPGLAQWACYKKASAYGSRVGWTPAQRNNNNNNNNNTFPIYICDDTHLYEIALKYNTHILHLYSNYLAKVYIMYNVMCGILFLTENFSL